MSNGAEHSDYVVDCFHRGSRGGTARACVQTGGESELPRQLKGAGRRARKQKLRKRGRVKREKMQRCKDLPQGEGLPGICQR